MTETRKFAGPTDPVELRQIAQIAAEASGAEQVILFGSVARGEAGPDSDLDLLLVFPDDADWLSGGLRAHRALSPRTFSLELVPMRRSHFDERRSVLAEVVAREGVVLYG